MFRIYNKHYLIPKIRFDHDKFSIRYKCAYLWNTLNTIISSLTNLNNCTVHIKNMLLNNDI